MRFARVGVILAGHCLSCSGAGAQGANPAIAAGFVAAAAGAQVAQSIAEEKARRNAPVTGAPAAVSPHCDNDDQYACLKIQPTASTGSSRGGRPAELEMSDDEARDYVLQYVNGVRKLNGVVLLARDGSLDTFAQAGSDELAIDHRPGAHLRAHAGDLGSSSAEVQGPADGSEGGALEDRVGAVLLRFMNEGPGGADYDTVLRPEWRKLGVGILTRDGRTFLTVDFSR
ncbi:MAG TPA: CAP domain-containing protein [Polyangiaceae bacterium]|nr:CAP domain-containing protein [Polyangiaceae bacterium]